MSPYPKQKNWSSERCPPGWQISSTTRKDGSKDDFYYMAPCGKRFRSMKSISDVYSAAVVEALGIARTKVCLYYHICNEESSHTGVSGAGEVPSRRWIPAGAAAVS